MKIYHDSPANGTHFDRNKTLRKIKPRQNLYSMCEIQSLSSKTPRCTTTTPTTEWSMAVDINGLSWTINQGCQISWFQELIFDIFYSFKFFFLIISQQYDGILSEYLFSLFFSDCIYSISTKITELHRNYFSSFD